MVDVTKQKQAEEAQRKSMSLLRAVTDGTTDAIFVKDLQDRYLLINPAGAHFLGKSVEEVIGKQDSELVDGETAARIVEGDRRVMASGQMQTYEEVATAGGVTRTYLSAKGPYKDPQGKLLGLLGISRDITERNRIKEHEAKLRIAREIQQGFFPATAPRLAGFDVGGASYPAEATGGDYFDYIPLADGSLAVAIGDASGHGFGAALLMAETRAYLRALALMHTDLSEILTLLNRALAREAVGIQFVTLLLGRIDPRTHTLTYGNAGHSTGYVIDATGNVKAALQSITPPLGIALQPHAPIGGAITLEPEDLVLLLTDGICEARSPQGVLFQDLDMLDFVRAHRHASAATIVDRLYRAVRTFSQAASQQDDMTAVVIKVGQTP
jgi:sigma-B regulation protein RsbU (phosphoserine phosphatase)